VTDKPETEQPKIFQLMLESLDHMKLTPSKKEFAKAVLRAAIEHAAMRQAGFIVQKDAKP
jgi:hypothetical protein